MSTIPLDEQEEALTREWLKPGKVYTKNESFGERSIRPEFKSE